MFKDSAGTNCENLITSNTFMIPTLILSIARIRNFLSAIRQTVTFRSLNLLKVTECLVFSRERFDELHEGNHGLFD